MKRLTVAVLLLLAADANAASLKLRSPWLADVVRAVPPQSGSSSGATSITSGSTPITGGADTQMCFNDSATLSCGDAGATYNKTTDSLTLVGAVNSATGLHTGRVTHGSAADAANAVDLGETAGAITFEGATADGFESRVTVVDPTVGDQTFQFPDVAAAGTKTVALTNFANVWNANQLFGATNINGINTTSNMGAGWFFGSSQNTYLGYLSPLTPDSFAIGVSALSNSGHVYEIGDGAFDFNNGPCGAAVCTNPQWIVHDKDQNTTNYQSLGLSGLSGGFRVTLAEGSATDIATLAVPAATSVSGELLYTVHARDATNSQTRSGRIIWSAVAEGTTATCVLGTAEELDNTPTGTLTATVTCDAATANLIKLRLNPTSSLTQTTLEGYGTLIVVGSGEALPQ